ncbi:MAG: MATE family efflux transporter [Hyphomicrobiaceae bacterium]
MTSSPVTHREVLAIAVPIILSNATEPLIGIVDTGVLGQLDKPHLVGAVALGATTLSLSSMVFRFLRMGTSRLPAQTDGEDDQKTVGATLVQALIVAAIAGVALIALHRPIGAIALHVLQGSAAVEEAAGTYLNIRIWSAPAALLNFVMLGWLIGLRRTKLAFLLQLLINGLNIVFDFVLVMGFGFEIEGVAYGTLAAEMIAVGVGLWIVRRELVRRGEMPDRADILDRRKLARVFSVNRDIMIRTVVLVSAFAFFVNEGAKGGDIILAANAVLYHIMSLAAYVLDGFAYAAEALVGHAVGARVKTRFIRAAQVSSVWAGGLSLGLTLLFWFAGPLFIDTLTVSENVRDTARTYLFWAALTPFAGFACYQLDGIFIGATRTADMRNATILSVLIYLGAWAVLTPAFGNHGLWASLIVLFLIRAVTFGALYPRMMRALFPEPVS